MEKLLFSDYQIRIFDEIRSSNRNVMVEAVAGSGKTTTIIEALKIINPMDRVLFLAFNKKIVTDIQAKTTRDVSTFHSLGFSAIRKQRRTRVQNYMYGLVKKHFGNNLPKAIYYCKKIVGLYKATRADIQELEEFYNLERPEFQGFEERFADFFEEAISNRPTIEFDDMLYEPVVNEYEFTKYDVVFIDEAQDLSPIQLDMLKLMKARRYVFVGDRYQSIYGFRGAQVDSIPQIIQEFECVCLPLSISYRCPEAIVKRAQMIVPHIEFLKEGGEVIWEKQQPKEGDLVLCRCTAPLVKECLNSIRRGVKAHVVGQEQDLQRAWDEVKDHGINEYRSIVQEKYKGSRLAEWMDTLDVLEALSEYDPNVENAISSVFGHTLGITFMTIHRSKGLEADNVFILEPELLPHPMARSSWERQQENNLHYVAITRALKKLCYMVNECVNF